MQYGPCDLQYGFMYAGNDWDWFQSITENNRTLVRDLGRFNWDDKVKVPIVAPLPPLKPGESRIVTVDTSGAAGADGRNGADGAPAPGTSRLDSTVSAWPVRGNDSFDSPFPVAIVKNPPPKRHNGEAKVGPMLTRAVIGHMYVIHVVDGVSDFYALFRVDSLERGDNCTISWKLIPAPIPEPSRKK
jgi:hypothetical protein